MSKGEFQVLKKTGTYADALVAIGLADLLGSFEHDGVTRKTRIVDEGEVYTIKISPELSIEEILKWKRDPGYIYIRIKKTDPVPPGFPWYDYEGEKEVEKNYQEFQKTTARKGKQIGKAMQEQGVIPPSKPKDDLSIMKIFNSMRMGSNAYNQLFQAILETDDMSSILLNKLSRFGFQNIKEVNQNNDDKLHNAVSTLQLFNPVAGKGVHRPKPDSSSPSSISPKLLDWFEEWMKFRAMHIGLLAYNTGNDGKDTKVMVIAPGDISTKNLKTLRDDLLSERIRGSVWLDIQASLNITEKLIKHSEEFQQGTGSIKLAGRTPKDIIRGIYNTYFKNLGTASAVMNVSFLGMPDWFQVHNHQDAEDWLGILAEHKKCLRTLDESHSNDIALLLTYRDFLSTGDYRTFFDFLAAYGAHFIQCQVQKKHAQAFTTQNLRRIFMSDFKEIIENHGFLNIATAIRKSTISPQIRKSMTGKAPFEIQYGLAQKWKRKVKFQNEFITELSEFVQSYNAENTKRMEQGKETRKNITTEDLNQVFTLIKHYGSELVGMLLLAYGYAREPREEESLDKVN
ncbi:hypothetical protein BR63_07370 [Thermanaerosceptrum fracticalcis]|uniref:Type I-B CRISPR-associated protein Cas8b1/Cst1 n=1 Tax=Thermanaerosceptrum fracticalcis TaxID=1712410 RepID=A0A7G6E243_THEFR|nr:hypothetical protein [Thermanaerosceptrum fracticalcis]QNB46147.1 hypothetical protein BR63_07370 [Thermanaerosceptrum fracticalcis]